MEGSPPRRDAPLARQRVARSAAPPAATHVHVRILRFRRVGASATAAPAPPASCCASRPTRRTARLDGPSCVQTRLVTGATKRWASTVAIGRDGPARAMGCQHAAVVSPGSDSDGVEFGYHVEPTFSGALLRQQQQQQQQRQQAAAGAPADTPALHLNFKLQPRGNGSGKGGTTLAGAELDLSALRFVPPRAGSAPHSVGSRSFAGWLPLSPAPDTSAVAEIQVDVTWSAAHASPGSPATTAVQVLPGDARKAISERYKLLEELGAGSFGTVWRAAPLSAGQGGEVAIKLVDKAECLRVGGRQAALQLLR